MQEKKDNIVGYYSASSDVVNAFTTGEASITVFMDINMPGLIDAGLDMKWVDAKEGSFAAPATINVVKGCQNPELAQLFVEYMCSEATQNIVAEAMNEAPVHKNATMSEELQVYLAYGEEAMLALKEFRPHMYEPGPQIPIEVTPFTDEEVEKAKNYVKGC